MLHLGEIGSVPGPSVPLLAARCLPVRDGMKLRIARETLPHTCAHYGGGSVATPTLCNTESSERPGVQRPAKNRIQFPTFEKRGLSWWNRAHLKLVAILCLQRLGSGGGAAAHACMRGTGL